MSGKPKVLISHSEVPKASLEVLQDKYELVFSPGVPRASREQLLKDAKGVQGVLWFSREQIDEEFIRSAGGQLKVVSCMTAGYDNVDVPLLKSLNIKVSNAPGILNNAVAEIAVLLVLATSRRLLEGYDALVTGNWDKGRPTFMNGRLLENSTVGIIGLGGVGCAVAKRVKAFEIYRLLYCGREEKEEGIQLGAEFVSIDKLLRESDFVIVTCALNDETRHLINKTSLEKMKRTSVLINVSRGEVVQQDDLVEALRGGVISGAGLDVMTPEPLPLDHPLTKLPNCVLSPHLGAQTRSSMEALAKLAAQNIYNALNDIPLLTPIY